MWQAVACRRACRSGGSGVRSFWVLLLVCLLAASAWPGGVVAGDPPASFVSTYSTVRHDGGWHQGPTTITLTCAPPSEDCVVLDVRFDEGPWLAYPEAGLTLTEAGCVELFARSSVAEAEPKEAFVDRTCIDVAAPVAAILEPMEGQVAVLGGEPLGPFGFWDREAPIIIGPMRVRWLVEDADSGIERVFVVLDGQMKYAGDAEAGNVTVVPDRSGSQELELRVYDGVHHRTRVRMDVYVAATTA